VAIRLTVTWLRLSGVLVVGAVALVVASYGWSSGSHPTGVPGVRLSVAFEAIVPCVAGISATAGLVDAWSWIERMSPRPAWVLPVVRLAGTMLAAGWPWLVTTAMPSSRACLALTVCAVSVAALAVGVLGSYAWVPLVVVAYAFLEVSSRHPMWFLWPHPRLAAAMIVVGGVFYLGAAVRRATP
jgi:hypothetical protein